MSRKYFWEFKNRRQQHRYLVSEEECLKFNIRHQSRNWLWRWLFKMPSKDECFKQLENQHRFMDLGSYYGFTDKAIIQKLVQSPQLQSELLELVSSETEKIQKQLNAIWHNQLNYPKIEFGQTVLHHLN